MYGQASICVHVYLPFCVLRNPVRIGRARAHHARREKSWDRIKLISSLKHADKTGHARRLSTPTQDFLVSMTDELKAGKSLEQKKNQYG